jgi:phage terminase large subunit GpA-like protein
VATDAWTTAAGVAAGHVFRPVKRNGVTGERLGENVVWQMLKRYAAEVGVTGIATHDLRRTCGGNGLDIQKAEDAVWLKLNEVLNTYYPTESGAVLPIVKYAIDSGYATGEVYAFARKYRDARALVIRATLVHRPRSASRRRSMWGRRA